MMRISEDKTLESPVVKMWYLGCLRCADRLWDFGFREKITNKKNGGVK